VTTRAERNPVQLLPDAKSACWLKDSRAERRSGIRTRTHNAGSPLRERAAGGRVLRADGVNLRVVLERGSKARDAMALAERSRRSTVIATMPTAMTAAVAVATMMNSGPPNTYSTVSRVVSL
jgi:hypothetical protein